MKKKSKRNWSMLTAWRWAEVFTTLHGLVEKLIHLIDILNDLILIYLWFLFMKVYFQNSGNHLMEIIEIILFQSHGDNPVSIAYEFWKLLYELVNIASLLVGLSGFLKHVGTFIKFLRLCTSQKSIRKWSWVSALESPIFILSNDT